MSDCCKCLSSVWVCFVVDFNIAINVIIVNCTANVYLCLTYSYIVHNSHSWSIFIKLKLFSLSSILLMYLNIPQIISTSVCSRCFKTYYLRINGNGVEIKCVNSSQTYICTFIRYVLYQILRILMASPISACFFKFIVLKYKFM